jgi:hypothetical protein
MVNCTKARALRHILKDAWSLPDDHALRHTGHDWVLILLTHLDEDMRTKLLFLWWRTWHLRSNVIFGDGKCGIDQSTHFLESHLHALQDSRSIEEQSDPKGKQPLTIPSTGKSTHNEEVELWRKPECSWAKLNFDAGFNDDLRSGS